MKIALWIVQALLAFAFVGAGFMKVATPAAELTAAMPWVVDTGVAMARFIGAVEILGAVGLILPALTRIKPILTPWAAMGLALVMVLAAVFHLSRGEVSMIAPNVVLFALSAFVAWGRFEKAPIAPRDGAAGGEASATA